MTDGVGQLRLRIVGACQISTQSVESSIDLEVWEAIAADAPRDLLASRDDRIATFRRHLDTEKPRDDYRKLLELSVIVLGGIPKGGIRFFRPGALRHARWTSQLINSIKIYLFQAQCRLEAKDLLGISRFVYFVLDICIPAWFVTPLAASDPAHDLAFAKSLVDYGDKDLARTTASLRPPPLVSERKARLPRTGVGTTLAMSVPHWRRSERW